MKRSGLVLVVDDEKSVRRTVPRVLNHAGFETIEACDGEQAIQMFEEHQEKIRCAVVDMTMPKLDGQQTCVELRKLEPALRVLMISGFDRKEILVRFVNDNMIGFVQKPFSPEELLTALSDVLEGPPPQPEAK